MGVDSDFLVPHLWRFLVLLLVGVSWSSIFATAAPGSDQNVDEGFQWNLPVEMNKVWPSGNPSETYEYYSFPFCRPAQVVPSGLTLLQIVRGDRLVSAPFSISFKKNVEKTMICEQQMTDDFILMMAKMVENDYLFEVFVDGLPVTASVGQQAEGQQANAFFLRNVYAFEIHHNRGQVVHVVLKDEGAFENLAINKNSVKFYYSVNWVPSQLSPAQRLASQLGARLTQETEFMDIHWLAIVNSLVLVLLVSSFLIVVVLRVVRSDLSKYLALPDEELAPGLEEESGWKLLHADIFRAPVHRLTFCACVGAGAQLLLCAVLILAAFLVAELRSAWADAPILRGGAVLVTLLFLLMVPTPFVGGYVSAKLYRELRGDKWAWNIVLTWLMFTGPAVVVWSVLNAVAWSYSSTAALPVSTVFMFFSLWLFGALTLTLMGGIYGRRKANPTFPCKTNKLAREIPKSHWYSSVWAQSFLSGLLPFSAMYIELHYIFSCAWGTKVYGLYGVLVLSCLFVLLVSASLALLLAYNHLNNEDHRWWWRAFRTGGALSFFFFGYCVFYFFTATRMTGLLQVSFFFGYSLVASWGIFLIMGFVSFASTYAFVLYIYARVKID